MSRFVLTCASWLAWSIFLTVSATNILVGGLVQLAVAPFDRERHTSLVLNRWLWGKALFALEPSFPILRRGLERVGGGPYVVVCNHSSVLDIPACMGLPVPLRVVGRVGLFRVPFMGWYMRFCRQIPLDAGDPASVEAFVAATRQTLAAGISVLVFPEGTRSQDATLGPFNRGAFRLAKDTNTPVLPVVVYGTHRVMCKGALPLQNLFTRIRVQVLDPIDPAASSTARKLSNRAHEAISAGLEQLRAEGVR
ncbi:MAG: 1-acyl-sn-glycerol-3-phosphate acyltransferase [Pseudomonadota bacterium]